MRVVMDETHERTPDSGFTLAEVLVALLLLSVLAGGTAMLLSLGAGMLARSRAETTAVLLAEVRLNQLRSLPWGYGSAEAPIAGTDETTDLSAAVPAAGGAGLQPSAATALDVDTPGLVDHLDDSGQWVGNAAGAPGPARFTRRWLVQRVATHSDIVLLHVRVVDRRAQIADVRLSTLRARTAG